MVLIFHTAVVLAELLAAAPASGKAAPAAPHACSATGAPGSCSVAAPKSGQSCSAAGKVSPAEKLRSFPDSTWEEARRAVEADDEVKEVESQMFGPQPPADPAEYASALARLLAKPGAELFAFAAYQGALPVENVGAEARLGEASVRIASLRAEGPVGKVFDYFLKSFESQGLRAQANQLGEGGAYFSFRASDGFLRTLTLVEAEGATMVLAAVGDPAKVKQGAAEFISDWPMPRVEEPPLDLSQAEGSIVQLSRHALVQATGPDEVIGFYLRQLPPLGWKSEPPAGVPGADMKVAEFSRGEQRCAVLASGGDGRTCGLNVMCVVRR